MADQGSATPDYTIGFHHRYLESMLPLMLEYLYTDTSHPYSLIVQFDVKSFCGIIGRSNARHMSSKKSDEI